ncbi:G-D-S-L family lipolytic protein [Phormidium sp. LEGE 05292]|uniref:GDSL-type esterase/lipase family protein n=1 Tax=[Phormidium] sp. LEGE 05292 TaxID=767427 RepID=UPI00187F0A66|nr:GDSL-type esterase/lipase family protein [Phormidium sp. LEGE 05292]MBE9225980.1 G-D-S-L family lipolytic protein [Phormidium sp. LEGE 05292]
MLLSPKSKKKNWGMVFSITLNIIFLTYVIVFIPKKGLTTYLMSQQLLGRYFNNTSQDNFRPSEFSSYYLDRRSLFEIIPQTPNNIVFLGDSLIERCEWSEILENSNVKNRGIAGDNLYGILKRLDQVTVNRPKKIFLMIGINDVISEQKLEEIVKKYRMVLSNIKQSSPSTEVYIQSVLPVNSRFNKPVDNNLIFRLNQELQVLAGEFNYQYIDLYSFFTIDNELSYRYTNDGIHLNGEGYAVWKEIIKNYVN